MIVHLTLIPLRNRHVDNQCNFLLLHHRDASYGLMSMQLLPGYLLEPKDDSCKPFESYVKDYVRCDCVLRWIGLVFDFLQKKKEVEKWFFSYRVLSSRVKIESNTTIHKQNWNVFAEWKMKRFRCENKTRLLIFTAIQCVRKACFSGSLQELLLSGLQSGKLLLLSQ